MEFREHINSTKPLSERLRCSSAGVVPPNVREWWGNVYLHNWICMHQLDIDVSGCEGQGTCLYPRNPQGTDQTCNEQHFIFFANRQAHSSNPDDYDLVSSSSELYHKLHVSRCHPIKNTPTFWKRPTRTLAARAMKSRPADSLKRKLWILLCLRR
jgi:hypothetical protein